MENRRLIDLDKIKPIDFPSTEMDGLDVVQYLNTLTTVDAVEVVRYKDCVHYDGEGCLLTYGEFEPNSMDFCSYGERRNDG